MSLIQILGTVILNLKYLIMASVDLALCRKLKNKRDLHTYMVQKCKCSNPDSDINEAGNIWLPDLEKTRLSFI